MYRSGSLSTSLAHDWQSHIPLSGALRSSLVRAAAYLGPSGEAAVMWAATPILTLPAGSACGPLVGLRHPGVEHRNATRLARRSFVALVKLSLITKVSRLQSCPPNAKLTGRAKAARTCKKSDYCSLHRGRAVRLSDRLGKVIISIPNHFLCNSAFTFETFADATYRYSIMALKNSSVTSTSCGSTSFSPS